MRYGATRGVFSNEAGCGTAPIAHAVSAQRSGVEQGFFGIFEVVADTLLLCSATAFVILLDGRAYRTLDGITLALQVYLGSLGPLCGALFSVMVVGFALATVVSWSHYGVVSLRYLFPKAHPRIAFWYLLLYALFCLPASVLPDGFLWDLTDFFVCTMTVCNLYALLRLFPRVKQESDAYFCALPGKREKKRRKS